MNDAKPNLTSVSVMVFVLGSFLDVNDMKRRAYAMMKNVEDYPAYMPSINSITVLERRENKMTTHWDAEIEGAPIRWVQQIQMNDSTREIIFKTTEGDFDVFQGKWQVGESDGQVFLKLSVQYKLGIPIIEEVLGPILKDKITTNSEMMLKAIADRLAEDKQTLESGSRA